MSPRPDRDVHHPDWRPSDDSELWEWIDFYRTHAFSQVADQLQARLLPATRLAVDRLGLLESPTTSGLVTSIGLRLPIPAKERLADGPAPLLIALDLSALLNEALNQVDALALGIVTTAAQAQSFLTSFGPEAEPSTFYELGTKAREVAAQPEWWDDRLVGVWASAVGPGLVALYGYLTLLSGFHSYDSNHLDADQHDSLAPKIVGRREHLEAGSLDAALTALEPLATIGERIVGDLDGEQAAGMRSLLDGIAAAVRHPDPDPVVLERLGGRLAASIARADNPTPGSPADRLAGIVESAAEIGQADETLDVAEAQHIVNGIIDTAVDGIEADELAAGQPRGKWRKRLTLAGELGGVAGFVPIIDTYLVKTGLTGQAAAGLLRLILAVMHAIPGA